MEKGSQDTLASRLPYKLQEFPSRMVDWDADQVSQGYAEACRKLQSLQQHGHSEAYEEALSN
jgi:hypothetical protein